MGALLRNRKYSWDGENLPNTPESVSIAKIIPTEKIKFVDGTQIQIIDESHDSYRVEKYWTITWEFGACGISLWEFFWREFQRQEEITVIMGNEFDFVTESLDYLVCNPFDLKEWYTTYRNIITSSLTVYRSGVEVNLVSEGAVTDLADGKITFLSPEIDDDRLTAIYETQWKIKIDAITPNDVTAFRNRTMLPLAVQMREVI